MGKSRITYTKSDPFDLPMSAIESSLNISPRAKGTTTSHITRIAASHPSTYDPILVWSRNQGTTYIIVDGYHRYRAACLQGATTIKAQLIYGELTEYDKQHIGQIPQCVIVAAYRENAKHGLALLQYERRNYAAQLCMTGVEDLDELAKETALSIGQVARISLAVDANIYQFSDEEQAVVTNEVRNARLFKYIHKYVQSLLNEDEQEVVTAMVETLVQLPLQQFDRVIQALESFIALLLEAHEQLETLMERTEE